MHVPDATLVYIMRDPIDRIISHYLHSIHRARERRPLVEALSDLENNNYVETSLYFKQLQAFLEYFDRKQILLFTLDDLKTDPGAVCRAIFKKVDVDPHFHHPCFYKQFHQTRNTFPRGGLAANLSRYAFSRPIQRALPFMYRKMDKPQLNSELRDRLTERLKPDVDDLRAFWGNDLEHWSV